MIKANIKADLNTFATLSRINHELRLERTAEGELIAMSPTNWQTGERNGEIFGQIWLWNRQKKAGKVFDSSTGFLLPNGAIRSPDVTWISINHQSALNPEVAFTLIVPDFVVELVSKSDNFAELSQKMKEYQKQGVRLGWLIDPQTQTVGIYRANKQDYLLNKPLTLSGEDVLVGFVLDLSEIWE
ncbi:Uma2 family endonuclease [Gloeocapsa sp. PCC 73106]|uniref:Uma2 family endonuclease n=1 Tax=Gloeocapsa sp. PCC 73106 TaxID=102232 RepID=UPI0002ABDB7B|nr:Uma2 family endonuclease [Gloeocapsa sp. PCC 73106]ELR98500.1 hypothetical protein GLO73106DRAFT_00023330 [Gloeocapsa sp. PCC 73106]